MTRRKYRGTTVGEYCSSCNNFRGRRQKGEVLVLVFERLVYIITVFAFT